MTFEECMCVCECVKWAGHVARMVQYDARRLTYKLLQYKSWDWIQNISKENGGSQLHGRRLHVWRWEWPVCKFFGKQSWQAAAQDKTSWNQQLENMINWMHR